MKMTYLGCTLEQKVLALQLREGSYLKDAFVKFSATNKGYIVGFKKVESNDFEFLETQSAKNRISDIRVFAKLDTAANTLRALGVTNFEVYLDDESRT